MFEKYFTYINFSWKMFATIRDTFNLLMWVQDSSHLFETHKECTSGTRDFFVGSR